MNWWRRLFHHYEAYHAFGPPRLKYAGYFGLVAFTAFYFLRFTRPNPQPFDDVATRLAGMVLFTLLALKDRWPDRFKPYYFGYSYAVMLYGLPFFTILTALERGGGVPAMSNIFIVLCLLVLLTDWRNTLVMLAAGTAAAVLAYVATSPNPTVPMDLVAQLPAFAAIVIGGNIFKFSTEQIEAERKLRATQALAGSIAHEMRNPLGQIRHNLERMQRALPEPTTQAQPQTLSAPQVDALYRHVAESEVAVRRGLQVIAMTLDEVSARPVDAAGFSYLSAAEATHKAVREYAFESEADRAKVSVLVTEDFSFRGDETAYLFVLFNLIKNALYCLALDPRARLTFSVGGNEVKVRDSGPGVSPDMLANLFQPFSSAGKSGGTGLGLAYCHRVMRAFGGDIGCESILGEFTQFTLSFPPIGDDERQAHSSGVLEQARRAFAGKRLLVVDDDAAQRVTTRHKLQPLDAQVDQAADGQRALEALGRKRYDLVLLDLNMPVLDGYALAQRIRRGQVPENRDVRIVAYTSEPAHLASVKTRKAGMDGLVSKPCAQLPLLRALHHALDHPAWQDGPDPALAGRRVLVADDSPANRKAVTAYLRHAGATVEEAGHGREVLDHLQGHQRWDAVLMDINMPGMDGLETSQAIRAGARAWRDIPIIALTAHSDQRTVQAARSAGMNDFLTKPVDASVLYAKLGQLVGGHAAPLPPYSPFSRSSAAPAAAGALLDAERLESYRRMGMLEELLQDYVPEIARLVTRLEQSAAAQDLQATLDALHSLLGMSGEAGAQALCRMVRRIYVPMIEERAWPAAAGWASQVAELAAETEQALKAYGSPRPAVSPG